MADRRTRKTKALIRSCFLQVMLEHPGRMAQVTELCERADINRSTFYFHYDTVYALLDELEEEFLAHVPYTLFAGGREDREAHRAEVAAFVAYARANRDLFCVLYQQNRIQGRVAERSVEVLAERYGDSSADARQLVAAYSCTGTYRLIYDWLARGAGSGAGPGEEQVTDLLLNLLYYTDQARRAAGDGESGAEG